MRALQPRLFKGEEIVYITGYHWVFVFKAFMPLLLVLIAGSIAWAFAPSRITSLVIMLAVLASIVWIVLKIFETIIKKAYVTNKRLIYRVGWTQRDTIDVTLDRIGGIKMDQDVWQRFFGYGTVQVIVPVVVIILPRFLRNPVAFRKALYMKAAAAQPEKPDDEIMAEEEARAAKEREEQEEDLFGSDTVPLSEIEQAALEAEAAPELGADLGADMGYESGAAEGADAADDAALVEADTAFDAGSDGGGDDDT